MVWCHFAKIHLEASISDHSSFTALFLGEKVFLWVLKEASRRILLVGERGFQAQNGWLWLGYIN